VVYTEPDTSEVSRDNFQSGRRNPPSTSPPNRSPKEPERTSDFTP
jgi:hypothetical protein